MNAVDIKNIKSERKFKDHSQVHYPTTLDK